MHEYSLVQALLARVAREAAAHRAASVAALRVRIGELAGVEPELFASAFELARMGSVAERAELELVSEAARWECVQCAKEMPRGEVLRCPACGAAARLAAGDALILERVELEVPEHV